MWKRTHSTVLENMFSFCFMSFNASSTFQKGACLPQCCITSSLYLLKSSRPYRKTMKTNYTIPNTTTMRLNSVSQNTPVQRSRSPDQWLSPAVIRICACVELPKPFLCVFILVLCSFVVLSIGLLSYLRGLFTVYDLCQFLDCGFCLGLIYIVWPVPWTCFCLTTFYALRIGIILPGLTDCICTCIPTPCPIVTQLSVNLNSGCTSGWH